jgi:hypothetical protein
LSHVTGASDHALHRHHSIAAIPIAESFAGKQAATVLGWFAIRGAQGGTQRECSEQCGYARASVAARVNALERAGLLVKTSERREHCAVYRSAS